MPLTCLIEHDQRSILTRANWPSVGALYVRGADEC